MYTLEEIKIANATSRGRGASVFKEDGTIRAVVPRYVVEHINKDDTILDFGAGKEAVHTKYLREEGFNVVAYEFGNNVVEGVHDKDALSKQYKVIIASNVLNVQSSERMLTETVWQIYSCLEPGGKFIANYPQTPRKTDLNADDVRYVIQGIFQSVPQRVGGTSSAPIWEICKYLN
jgi:hypothetical protein